ncbi:MAG: tetratricopeptide repeat protein [Magnetococcales bacterium]|nr:tetratricopeptide repeat protein [Magnetococcales bacterium]
MAKQKTLNKNCVELTVETAFEQALNHVNSGRLSDADKLCTAIIKEVPNHIDAINLIGIIAQRVNQHNIAIEQFEKAIDINQNIGVLHYNLAISLNVSGHRKEAIAALKTAQKLAPENSQITTMLNAFSDPQNAADSYLKNGIFCHQSGKLDEAIFYYIRSLEIMPENSAVLNNLGGALLAKGLNNEAILHLEKALKIEPDYPGAHNNIGQAKQAQGRLDDAIIHYQQAINLQKDFTQAHNNLGNINQEQGNLDSAILNYQKAIATDPNFAQAYNNLGNVFIAQSKFDQAIANLNKAITIQPNYAQAHSNLALAQQKKGMLINAIASCKKAIEIAPTFAQAHYNMAITLQELGEASKAITSYQKAIAIDPNYADAYNNLGNALKEQGRIEDAITSYEKTVELNPNCADAIHNLTLAQLLNCDFKNGWKNYDLRFNTPQFNSVRFVKHEKALYDGGPLSNKTMLIWSEQGVGESILFSSMIPDLIAKGADIVFECDKRLIPIFTRSFPQIKCIENVDPHKVKSQYDEYDYIVPTGNLCRWLRPDINSYKNSQPHLQANLQKAATIRKRYNNNNDKTVIGIAWHSKNKNHGANKSIKLHELLPLFNIPNAVFVDLQYGDTKQERDDLTKKTGINLIHDETIDQMADLDGFAAQVAAMDLIVTISNTTAHMAGALGVPTILMLAITPLWYWMMDRNDSPWYSSIRIIRQNKCGEWSKVINNVRKEVILITNRV